MKEDRVEFRTSHQERAQFEMAAAYLGMNLSSFLRMAALERSAEIVKKSDILLMSDKDRDIFLSALKSLQNQKQGLKKNFFRLQKKAVGWTIKHCRAISN